tara:strand:- start:251 stop:1330 length:1080 start_codon:yes stop_codon:yes gene_type:complete
MLVQTRSRFAMIMACVIFLISFPLSGEEVQFKDYTEGLNIPEVVAKVNGVGVSSDYVKFKFNRVMARIESSLLQKPDGAQTMLKMMTLVERKKALIDLIDKEIVRELMYQQAKKQNKVADPKVIDQEMNNLKKMLGKEKKFYKELKLRGLTVDSLRFNLGIDYLIQQLIEDNIKGKINITDKKVRDFYEENLSRFQRPEAFRVGQIFFHHFAPEMMKNVPSDQLKTKAEEYSKISETNINNILSEIRAGADFAEMARKFSQDEGSASKGGDMGFVYKGVFPKLLDETISKLKKGEISDVVASQYGYHILQLLETKSSETAPFEDLKESIQKHLFGKQGKKKIQEFVDDLRNKSEVEMLY